MYRVSLTVGVLVALVGLGLFGGRQYIVVAIGGVKHPAEYVAFSLP